MFFREGRIEVKSEEFPTGAQRRILKTELKQFV